MSRLGSEKRITAGYHERAEALVGLISERDAAISALEYEVRRLTIELQKQTKVWGDGDDGDWNHRPDEKSVVVMCVSVL